MEGHDDEEHRARGRAVRDARLRLGLTQQELAGHVGVSIATVARWEVGANRISRLGLRALAAFLRERGEAVPADLGAR